MILIIGGAYQGKLEYAQAHYGKQASVWECTETGSELDFTHPVIHSFHLFLLAQVRQGVDSLEYLREHQEQLQDKIIICDDISGGVVPIDREMRDWRDSLGRSLTLLGQQADEVIRVFCGIGMRVK